MERESKNVFGWYRLVTVRMPIWGCQNGQAVGVGITEYVLDCYDHRYYLEYYLYEYVP